MTIGKARLYLIDWLSHRMRIDRWGLGLPENVEDDNKPASIGLDKPALNLEIISSEGWEDGKVCQIAAVLPFQVIYRFSSANTYSQIPRSQAEDLLSNLLIAAKDHNCFPEYFNTVEPSGSVSVAEIKNSDQLLLFEIDFSVVVESMVEPTYKVFL